MSTSIASYRYQRFYGQGEFTLYTDRLVTVASNLCGKRHEASYMLTEIKLEPKRHRLWVCSTRWDLPMIVTRVYVWKLWHSIPWFLCVGIPSAFLGACLAAFGLLQVLSVLMLITFATLAAACFFVNGRFEQSWFFQMSNQRVLGICADRKNSEACERFVQQLNEAILEARKAPDGE